MRETNNDRVRVGVGLDRQRDRMRKEGKRGGERERWSTQQQPALSVASVPLCESTTPLRK